MKIKIYLDYKMIRYREPNLRKRANYYNSGLDVDIRSCFVSIEPHCLFRIYVCIDYDILYKIPYFIFLAPNA